MSPIVRVYWVRKIQQGLGSSAALLLTLSQIRACTASDGIVPVVGGFTEASYLGGSITFGLAFLLCAALLTHWDQPFKRQSKAICERLEACAKGWGARIGLKDIPNEAYRVTVFRPRVRFGRLVIKPHERIGKYCEQKSRVHFGKGEGCAGEAWEKGLPLAKWDKKGSNHLPYDKREEWANTTGVPGHCRKKLGNNLAYHLVCVPIFKCKDGKHEAKPESVIAVVSLDIYEVLPKSAESKIVKGLEGLAKVISDMIEISEEMSNG